MALICKLTGLFFGLWMMAGSAYAVTPSNTLLTNSATLTYNGNPTGITSSVTVTVELVSAAVTIATSYSAPSVSVNKAENQSYSAIYTVQSHANGPDTYTIDAAYLSVNDIVGAALPLVSSSSVSSSAMTLGVSAATATAASGQPVINVPADGSAGTAINELQANDKVVINGAIYEILSVVDNASGISTITLKTNLASALAIGDAIYEYKQFSVDIADLGAIAGGAINRLDLTTTVVADSGSKPVYALEVAINIVAISIKKYVREISAACTTLTCSTAATISYDDGDGSASYYDAGVEAAPGEILEYLLVITSSSATITTALVTDILPDQFTSYVPTTTTLNAINVDDEVSAPVFPLDSGADDGGLKVDDNLSRPIGTEGSGSIGTSKTVYVTYQVLIAG